MIPMSLSLCLNSKSYDNSRNEPLRTMNLNIFPSLPLSALIDRKYHFPFCMSQSNPKRWIANKLHIIIKIIDFFLNY